MPKIRTITGKLCNSPESIWVFWCPGCSTYHHIKTPPWTFNGDVEKPTVSPSILVNPTSQRPPGALRCHSFIRDGQIQFLDDCEHPLHGQTVDLLDVDET